MGTLWKYFAVTILAFCLVGVYAMAAFNLKVFNPIAEILDDYSFTDFYYKLQAEAGVQDTSRIVTIVDMTELRKRRDFADLFMEVNALGSGVGVRLNVVMYCTVSGAMVSLSGMIALIAAVCEKNRWAKLAYALSLVPFIFVMGLTDTRA
jgi:hypothetical protein